MAFVRRCADVKTSEIYITAYRSLKILQCWQGFNNPQIRNNWAVLKSSFRICMCKSICKNNRISKFLLNTNKTLQYNFHSSKYHLRMTNYILLKCNTLCHHIKIFLYTTVRSKIGTILVVVSNLAVARQHE